MESRVLRKPRLVFTMQTEEAYRQLQLDCGTLSGGQSWTGDSEMVPDGQVSTADCGMVPRRQASTADSRMIPEGQPYRGSCGQIQLGDVPVPSSGERVSIEKETNRRTIMTREDSDNSNRNCTTRREATRSPTFQKTSGTSLVSPNNGNLSDSSQDHQGKTIGQMTKGFDRSEQRDRCASQRVSGTVTHRPELDSNVDAGSSRCGARCEKDTTVTRCSVQVGANRNYCSVWKKPDGNKTLLPKALRDFPRKANSCTQTAMLSFSAPAQLGGANPAVSSQDCSSTALQQNANNDSGRPSNSPSLDVGVHDDLPTYEEISRTHLLTPSSDPPPGYQELFGTVIPESLNRVHSGGGPSLPRGPAARTFWKPQTTRRQKRRCCFGCLNDKECWILVLANGGFILIFILAAIYSK